MSSSQFVAVVSSVHILKDERLGKKVCMEVSENTPNDGKCVERARL